MSLPQSLFLIFFFLSPRPADGQKTEGGGGTGVDRVQVTFTPTICKVHCVQDQCVNYCERGNMTTLSSDTGAGRRDGSHGPGFRVFLCPLLCKNGGVCVQKDRCLCPTNFTGKFCQIAVTTTTPTATTAPSSTNHIIKPAHLLSPGMVANQKLTQSEFLLPLRQDQEAERSRDSPSMVTVRVQHPPEASVKVHQVMKVSGFSPMLRVLTSRTHSGSAGAPAPAARGVQAQTLRGDVTYTQHSGFKYCFREVRNGQCSSPLPGLRSRDTCCRGIGKAWGITDCVLCPQNTGPDNSSCPVGFERGNGTQCVDVNECLQLRLCENGMCVNTRGSYSCVCRTGYILDATHGICISQSVISQEKSQCYRVLGPGQGPSSCSLPILRNITKQICCCSRVGKAWGPNCQRCPYFGSAAFKEICPAGPGYHYSASTLQFNQRVSQHLSRHGAPVVMQRVHDSGSGSLNSGGSRSQLTSSGQTRSTGSVSGSVGTNSSSTSQRGTSLPQALPAVGSPSSRPVQPDTGGPTVFWDKPLTVGRPASQQNPPSQPRPVPSLTTQPRPQLSNGTHAAVWGVCHSTPGVCGRGQCVDQPGGKHTCVCDQGYQTNAQRTHCQDIDECRQNLCMNGLCENTPGSFRCLCHRGYRIQGNTCADVDECEDALLCPGQECVNSQGSYRCVSCHAGYTLINRLCTDIDECRHAPCSNGHCQNTPGSYHCVCRHGYKLQGNTCTDVDECLYPSQCPDQMCVNSVGSYHCVSCAPGYTLINRQCTDVNECEDRGSCPNQDCVNTEGSYRCVDCKKGFHTVDGVCTDIDECSNMDTCDGERVCVNTVGSFRCDCPPGYQTSGPGRQCRDINECFEGEFCFPRGECVNTQGSYTCVCAQGFTLSDNRTSCLDVDECLKSTVCLDGSCVNTEGSFQCLCQTGFTTNPEKTACLDVDECVSSRGSVCGSRRCENTIGSYRCLTSCQPGYQVASTGRCVDINECANKTVCGDHAFCQNLIGTYQCVCDQGFISMADGKACVDEDECVSLQGVCGLARCENVEGSFMCECDGQGEEFDTRTRQCVNTVGQGQPGFTSSSSSYPGGGVLMPVMPPLPAAQPGELRECYYNLAEQGTCSLLATNSSQQECCCTVGEAWGLGCQYHTCPLMDTAEFLSLCPSGRGYVTAGPGAFSYKDVDECKRFHPEVCKNGVCVNNIPGYTCYCSSGYVYDGTLLECVDHDECEEESCVGGICVNTVGSYYCSCQRPLVLDDTQRNCVNSSLLTVDDNLSFCWQHVTAALVCQNPLLGAQVTFMDCCCFYGEGWGLQCALCPASDTEDYAALCHSVRPLFPENLPDSAGTETEDRLGEGRGRGGAGAPPYSGLDSFPDADYDDYAPAGGSRSSFTGRTPTYRLPDSTYRRPGYSTGYYMEGDYVTPDGFVLQPGSFQRSSEPRSERTFGAQPPVSLPLPAAPYEDMEEELEEEPWRSGPPFPPFTDRSRGDAAAAGGGGTLRRVYERRYESHAGLNAAEDCGILHGCENGRCIRVAEGYTCDCYQGFELDLTSMTCIDVNECEDGVDVAFPCVNARCVNTEGSFRCVCRRGYIMSRRPNHCVAA